MKIVLLASLLMVVAYPSVCHGLPTPEADPYRYETGKDNRQVAAVWEKVQPADKSYGPELLYPEKNGKRRPFYPKNFYAVNRKKPTYQKEKDPYVILMLERVPKQTPYDPIPYAVYFEVTADGVDVDDSEISY